MKCESTYEENAFQNVVCKKWRPICLCLRISLSRFDFNQSFIWLCGWTLFSYRVTHLVYNTDVKLVIVPSSTAHDNVIRRMFHKSSASNCNEKTQRYKLYIFKKVYGNRSCSWTILFDGTSAQFNSPLFCCFYHLILRHSKKVGLGKHSESHFPESRNVNRQLR